jgi:hypothetical protein
LRDETGEKGLTKYNAGVTASTRTVLEYLKRVQAVPLRVNDQAYLCRTPLVGEAAVAFRVAEAVSA